MLVLGDLALVFDEAGAPRRLVGAVVRGDGRVAAEPPLAGLVVLLNQLRAQDILLRLPRRLR